MTSADGGQAIPGGLTDPAAAEVSGGPAARSSLKLKERAVPDPPEIDPRHARRAPVFVAGVVLIAALVMGLVLILNVIADPYGTVGTHLLPTVTTSDRTVKADRIEELATAPQLVVLGSSRAMRYEPSYLERKTGLTTFNAGINGIGGTADAWAFTQFMHEVWPESHPAYLWLIDVESFVPFAIQARTANERRLAKYVGAGGTGPLELTKDVWENRTTMFSLATAWDSARILLYKEDAKDKQNRYQKTILADGVLKERPWSQKEWDKRYPNSVQRYSELYKTVYRRLDPEAERYFEQTLRFMNEQGAAPLLVVTPINPKLAKVLNPLGRTQRHRQVMQYIDALHGTYRFEFLDLTDPSLFDFDPKEFYDGVHMTSVNTRKAIDCILAESGGISTPTPPAHAQ